MNSGLQLRDIQLPPEPGLWPWPPGIWLLLAIAAVVLAWLVLRMRRAAARRRRIHQWRQALRTVAGNRRAAPIERVAAASELLRRAVRQRHPEAAALEGAAWRAHLAALGPLAEPDSGLDLLVHGPWRAHLADADAELAVSRADERLQRLLEQWP